MDDTIIRVLIVDDHELVRRGIAATLESAPGIEVVGDVADGEMAVREAARLVPDIIIMDVRLPGVSGIEACREILSRHPDIGVLMLTSYSDERAVLSALLAGARGFMLKEVKTSQLISALRTLGRGESMLDPKSTARLVDQLRHSAVVSDEDQIVHGLSERERDILALIAEGRTNREIGERLFLSEKTVKHNVSDILAHLGMTRRIEAATFEVRRQARHLGDE